MITREKRKKLCVIIPAHWAAVMGGSQYQAKVMIDHLLQQGGYEISYLASRVNPLFKPAGYSVLQIAERKGLRRYGYFFDARRLLQLLSDIKPDIIYQRVGCAYTGIAAFYAKQNNCKMVWHVAHDRTLMPFDSTLSLDLPFRYIERKIFEYGIANATNIVAQTTLQRDLLERRFQRTAIVIPNFHPLPQEEICKRDPIRVVWVANLKPWKRPELFVRLASDFEQVPNLEFLMAGEPPTVWGEQWDAGMKETIERLRNFRYLGPLSQEQVNELLATSHIFVNTSRYEGFANTFIQAWQRKVPVVSFEVNPDNVLDGESIGFCAEADYAKMRAQIMRLIEDGRMREQIGERAARYALENHGERNIRRLVELL